MGCSSSALITSSRLYSRPQLQSRALGRSGTHTTRRDQDPSARLSRAAPHPQDRTPGSAPASPWLPRHLPRPPRPPALPDSPRAPVGQEATGRGAARRSPAQEEGSSQRRLQRRWRRPCCGAAAALSRNFALPSPPRASCPQMWDSSGKKFGCGSGTPSAAPQHPPRAASPPAAVAAAPARCPPGRV